VCVCVCVCVFENMCVYDCVSDVDVNNAWRQNSEHAKHKWFEFVFVCECSWSHYFAVWGQDVMKTNECSKHIHVEHVECNLWDSNCLCLLKGWGSD